MAMSNGAHPAGARTGCSGRAGRHGTRVSGLRHPIYQILKQSGARVARPSPSSRTSVAAFEGVATLPEQRTDGTAISFGYPETFASKYTLGEMLGQGTHAKVHVAVNNATGEQFAVKVLLKKKAYRDRTAQVVMEVEHALQLQKSRHAVRIHDVLEEGNYMYIIQELLTGGDITELLMMNPGGLPEQEAARVMAGVLGFISEAHAMGICYGDIKPANFVLRSMYPNIQHLLDPSKPKGTLDVVAVDFGCCMSQRHEGCLPDSRVTGTPMYMAPEVLRGCQKAEVDMWAAGIMLYQLLTDRFPFWDLECHKLDSLGPSAIRDGILHGAPLFGLDPWSTRVHRSAQDLICRMLDRDTDRRISAAEALEHPWFAQALAAGEQ